jgi:hypothetical protein
MQAKPLKWKDIGLLSDGAAGAGRALAFPWVRQTEGGAPMLDVARRTAVLPATSGRWVWALLSVSGFGWLLSQDAIHPLVVFGLELFLSF